MENVCAQYFATWLVRQVVSVRGSNILQLSFLTKLKVDRSFPKVGMVARTCQGARKKFKGNLRFRSAKCQNLAESVSSKTLTA